MLLQALAVIGEQDHQGVVEAARRPQALQQHAGLLVGPRHLGQVQGARLTHVVEEHLPGVALRGQVGDGRHRAVDLALVAGQAQLGGQAGRGGEPGRVGIVVVDEEEQVLRRVGGGGGGQGAGGDVGGVAHVHAAGGLGAGVVVGGEAARQAHRLLQRRGPEDRRRLPAARGQRLGQQGHVLGDGVAVADHPVLVRVQAREDAGVRAERGGRAGERPLEAHPLGREAIGHRGLGTGALSGLQAEAPVRDLLVAAQRVGAGGVPAHHDHGPGRHGRR